MREQIEADERQAFQPGDERDTIAGRLNGVGMAVAERGGVVQMGQLRELFCCSPKCGRRTDVAFGQTQLFQLLQVAQLFDCSEKPSVC